MSNIETIGSWSNFLMPILIVPIGVVLKTIWDRYTNLKIEKSQSIKRHMIEITQHKLENFYWPIYIRLLKINEIESKIKIQNTYHYKKRKNNKNIHHDICIEIDNKNDDDDHMINLRSSDLSSTEEEYTSSDEEEHNWDKMNEIIKIYKKTDKKTSIRDIYDTVCTYFLKKKSTDTGSSRNFYNDMDLQENEENLVERRKNTVDKKHIYYLDVDIDIINKILENIFLIYCELEEIIIKNIHIAEVNKKLKKELLKFLKFITMLKVLRENKQNLTPPDFGAKYPKQLLDLIDKNVTSLQKLYNTIIYN